MTFGVNYLAPVLLTRLLIHKIYESDSGRIINVSAKLHEIYNNKKFPFDDL